MRGEDKNNTKGAVFGQWVEVEAEGGHVRTGVCLFSHSNRTPLRLRSASIRLLFSAVPSNQKSATLSSLLAPSLAF